jgi:LysR family pca operon transcriptional activator
MVGDRIKLRHLQCFLEVVNQRSLTKAARALRLTQPTVSKALKELERELGLRLLERDRQGVALTEAGRDFRHFAEVSVSALRAGFGYAARRNNPAGAAVALGCPPYIASSLIPGAISEFTARHPDARIELYCDSNVYQIAQLQQGEIEMIVGRIPDANHVVGFSFEPLYNERQVIVMRAGHPLRKARRFVAARMADYPFILYRAASALRQEVDRFLTSLGLPHIEPQVATNSADFAREYAAHSDALWCAPQDAVEPDLASGALILAPVDTSPLLTPIGVTTRANTPPVGLARAFIAAVRKASQPFAARERVRRRE